MKGEIKMFRYIIAIKIVAPRLKIRYDDNKQTCYDCDEKCLIIGNDFNGNDCGFMRHLREVHKYADADQYCFALWTLLHEIGHYYTIDYVEDDLWTRTFCGLFSCEEASKDSELQDMYFNIKSEWEATEWAIKWISSHKRIAKILNWIVR